MRACSLEEEEEKRKEVEEEKRKESIERIKNEERKMKSKR